MPKISETPDSVLPYYIRAKDMNFCYFVARYKNGSSLAQYEEADDGRFVAHHLTEVNRNKVKYFEVWGLKTDGDSFFTECLKSIRVKNKMKLFFKYRLTQHISLNLKIKKALFGYITKKEQKIWEIDKTLNVREHLMEEK